MLLRRPMSIAEIARLQERPPVEIEQDVKHLLRSLKRSRYRATIIPARCRKCGFGFRADKLRKPGKCPRCRATWIEEPLLELRDSES